jgi:hypothetical protein
MRHGKLIATGLGEPDEDVWGELGRAEWVAFLADLRRGGRPRPFFRPTARHGRRHPRRQKGRRP